MNEHITPRSVVRDDADDQERRLAKANEAETSELARHTDPSLVAKDEVAKAKAHEVEWVRPSELLVSRSGRIAGRGIDFQAEFARRSRHATIQTAGATGRGVMKAGHAVSERARKLPPASAFGRGSGGRFSWVSRSGIGLG
ncbi:hypothetical protein IT882_05485 [Microbacterium schleiferi]|uniref:Uncharacterized protein n=1 Tax=Microbacterium schleiferi TaxID=69362 RepID=A0A7S8MZA8_9MICO|nr:MULTISPECIES: hypothetical protein [Actinomycetes]QPE05478.1 hypothetical protein IT882_05485 [Microbacterium schleiferi]